VVRSVLTIKLGRDLRRRPAQLVAAVILVVLGVALFGAAYDAYRNLDASYRSIFDRYRFADITLVGGAADAIARRAAATPGVAAVQVRTVADVPLRTPGGAGLIGRVVGMPPAGPPAVDRVKVLSGRPIDPRAPSGVLVERHLARHAHLAAGSRVRAWGDGGWQPLDVRGVVASPEYLWPAASRQDVLPDPGGFGVLFVPEPVAERLARSAPASRQVTVYYTASGRRAAAHLDATLAALARANGATDAVTRAEQPSNAALSEDIKGFAELAVAFPGLFLGAAGVAIYVVLARRVARDRAIIGMLRASGFRRRTVLAHYLSTGLLTGLAGAVPGVLAGLALAGAVTRLYTGAIGVPDTIVAVHATTVFGGLAFALVAGGAAALAPAIAAARVPPAEAMRGTTPATGGRRRGPFARLRRVPSAGRRRLPAGAWLVLRGPARRPRRTILTEVGVALALVLVLVSWGMLDTSKATVSRQFDVVQRQDARLTFDRPVDAVTLGDLAARPGVQAAEPSARLPITLTAGGRTYSTALIALRAGTVMHTFLAPSGHARPLPRDGVLLGAALRRTLGVDVGDRIPLRLPAGTAPAGTAPAAAEATVAGFVAEPLGTYAYASLGYLRTLAPAARPDAALVRFAPGADRAALRSALSGRPGVLTYTDARALRQAVNSYMRLFYVFVAVMLVFGGLLAFTVLFATMSVNIAERDVEVATLRAFGVPRRRLSRLITTENLLVIGLGLLPGLILGRLATAAFLGAFNSDLLAFHADIRPATYAWSAAAIAAAALLAQRPGLRALGRLDLARVVRERAA
jgi:putative ABC transport system permease protein